MANAIKVEIYLGRPKTSSDVSLSISPMQNSAGYIGMILVKIKFFRETATRF